MPDSAIEYGDGYKESDDFVPDPTAQFGTLDTSGTAGAAHAKIEEVTPIFEVARRQNLATAARALDPNDREVDESLVTLPQGQNFVPVDVEGAKDALRQKAEGADEPVQVATFRGPAQAAAADEGKDAAADAQAQQNDQGAGGTEAGDLARQTNDDGDAPKASSGKSDSEEKDDAEKKANAAAKKAQAEAKKSAS